ncbi:Metaxin-2 [Larimichthys crocea]|uniref:Uncharacterized protein n=1 Tax=Larimichthys crocea TaxID=215358 RepID=A0ACD3QC16_LARCR|nr:Metaxin-2 [Larimichthys crocea]
MSLAAEAFVSQMAGKIPFIHVGNQVVSELGPIVQFTKAKLYIQWCDDATAAEISRPRYSSPYSWPLSNILAYQKQWEVRRKMNAVGPTELDALVFGHLFTILTTRLTSTELAEKIKSYSNLLSFCRRIEQTYFEDKSSS